MFNREERELQVLLALALRGPQTKYGLAKTIANYTGETSESVRVILHRVLPGLIDKELVEVNPLDITLKGISSLSEMFELKDFHDALLENGYLTTYAEPSTLDVKLIQAIAIERKLREHGPLLIVSLLAYPDPLFTDFRKGWLDIVYINTKSVEILWRRKIEGNSNVIYLEELNIKYDFIFNELVRHRKLPRRKAYWKENLDFIMPSKESITLDDVLFGLFEELYFNDDRLLYVIGFIDDFSENVRKYIIKNFIAELNYHMYTFKTYLEEFFFMKSGKHHAILHELLQTYRKIKGFLEIKDIEDIVKKLEKFKETIASLDKEKMV